jgi:endonuclease YncB( thermonuclease family)
MKFFTLVLALLMAAALAVPAPAHSLDAMVMAVYDGDTIVVMSDGHKQTIRLYGVDCPEKTQDFGRQAAHFTTAAVLGKTITVRDSGTDDYGRRVGMVMYGGACLNEELIRSGQGWVYRHFCDRPVCSSWVQLEKSARAGKLGLWAQPHPVPPWKFRHAEGRMQQSKQATVHKPPTGLLHGNTSSRVFHSPACAAYTCKNCTAVFTSRDEAVAAGYKPCGKCRPD